MPRAEVLAAVVNGAGVVVESMIAKEHVTAFASAQVKWGLVLEAGTGSFVHGTTEEGQDLHYGGLGPTLGDEGSAYAIGLAGMRAAFASARSAARRTSLAKALPAALEVEDLWGVFKRVYVEQMKRRDIASLARVVDAEAEAGDAIARRCLEQAAEEFAELARDVVEQLGMAACAFPVVPMGSVARGSRIWWERVEARVREFAPQAYVVTPRLSPAGARRWWRWRRWGWSGRRKSWGGWRGGSNGLISHGWTRMNLDNGRRRELSGSGAG